MQLHLASNDNGNELGNLPFATHRGCCRLLVGSNFSGRSALLRKVAHAADSAFGRGCAYIGPDVSTAISALAPSVRDELQFHAAQSGLEFLVRTLCAEWQLEGLAERNPFTLSGGEQCLMVLLAKYALAPTFLGADCMLEQLDVKRKAFVLEAIKAPRFEGTVTVLVDNRHDENDLYKDVEKLPVWEHTVDTAKLPIMPLNNSIILPPIKAQARSLMCTDLAFGYYSSHPILKGLCMELQPGRIYALTGENGAGKSTLARLLCGVLHARSGSFSHGHTGFDPWRNPGQLVAYHFQNPDVQFFCSTVDEELNISTPQPEHNLLWAETFGLQQLLSLHPMDLPFVCRKRLAVASVLAMMRPWTILDEPTLAQDSDTCHKMSQILLALAGSGAGVIVITHSERFIHQLRAQRLSLTNGQLLLQ